MIDPLLGPLANNGGTTLTHALLPGSPALDGGALVTSVPQGFDQRGNPYYRMVDGTGDGIVRIDVGAYESQGVPSFTPGDYNRDGLVDACDYTVWRSSVGAEVVPFTDADGNGNGHVDYDDFEVWKSHFGDGLTFATGGGPGSSLAASFESATPAASLLAPPLVNRTNVERIAHVPGRASSSPAIAAATSDGLLAWLATRPLHAGANEDAFSLQPNADDAGDSEFDPDAGAFDLALAAFGNEL